MQGPLKKAVARAMRQWFSGQGDDTQSKDGGEMSDDDELDGGGGGGGVVRRESEANGYVLELPSITHLKHLVITIYDALSQ